MLDAVAREGISPTAEHTARLLDIGAQGVSRVVGLRLARLQPQELALLRAASVLGDGIELRHAAALAGVETAELVRPPPLIRLHILRREDPLSSFIPLSVAPSTRRSTSSRRTAPAAELLLEAGALPENAAGHVLRIAPQPTRSWSRRFVKRPTGHSLKVQPMPRSNI